MQWARGAHGTGRTVSGEYVLSFLDRVAGAPISWGVCEVPGWGLELPVARVLSEMSEVGLTATELGSEGYLPCLLYTSPSPRDKRQSRMPSSA